MLVVYMACSGSSSDQDGHRIYVPQETLAAGRGEKELYILL